MNRLVSLLAVITVISTIAAQAAEIGVTDVSDVQGELSPVFLSDSTVSALDDKQAVYFGEPVFVGAVPLSERDFDLTKRMTFALQADTVAKGVVEAVSHDPDSAAERKNPGRALLLSAIMPGAGELYGGSKIKAALFFALEVGCWVGGIRYAQEGDKKTDEFEAYADVHWSEDTYRGIEYNFAQQTYDASEAFTGTQPEWETLEWDEKIDYLPGNFTHELPTTTNQQYYESIGKYLTQFGFGWDDQLNDDGATPSIWDGTSTRANLYIDMRYDANQLLDKSATFFMVIMANHVVSALDAGFSVRAKNRAIARAKVEVGARAINGIPVAFGGIKVTF